MIWYSSPPLKVEHAFKTHHKAKTNIISPKFQYKLFLSLSNSVTLVADLILPS